MPKVIKKPYIIRYSVLNKMICGCSKKWIRLTYMDAKKLNMTDTKYCINHHYMYPYFVHDDDGDYYAPQSICKKEYSGKYIYFCTKCKNIAENE